ncbi:hypothetical protein C2G38_2251950 [Gigaspora rosea]|uniref:BACK domain-containing protein n=1 Tax=Gigaspora rosea TaxID=44941 RepID=A0A397UHJ4_9GLOM|nr:hypothetical protein C2G38_2251950 [Gigaspora rosea]
MSLKFLDKLSQEFTQLLESEYGYDTLLIDNNASWLRLNFSRVYHISFLSEKFKALQEFYNDILAKYLNMVVFNSEDFTTFQENVLIALLKNNELQMNESEIWDKLILWGKAKTPNLPTDLKE